ncbi:MAG TPA: chromosomal replication initiator protein DnaA, partial [Candidatus Krumholzibacterium sp.]|nr:chromosomal replication initiator protein DnaA [Candidatus Krumholzibacterium sp.]
MEKDHKTDELGAVWKKILGLIEKRINVQSFKTWFEPTRLLAHEEGTITVGGPNSFFIDWLAEHHKDRISEAAEEVLGDSVRIEFSSPSSTRGEIRVSESKTFERKTLIQDTVMLPNRIQLYSRYTFSEFVVGNSNRLAQAAALAVAEMPARTYNPLFIYGGPGLGKTHLIQAIGHYMLQEHPGMRICYVSTESFVNELIQAIRNGSTPDFKERYRNVDILLIDDIHFLAGKERTQEEFFFTFNALHESGKQIVCTSDRPPKEIPTLQDRLVSRFEWGLVVDIKAPDFETRMAILRKKAADDGLTLDDEVIDYIAHNCTASVREL